MGNSRELERDAARWRAIFETAGDAVISIGADGAIAMFNPAAESIFGYARDEVLGKNVRVLMPEPYRAEHDGYLAHYEQTGRPRAIGRIRHVQAQRKDGTVFPIELAVSRAAVDGEVVYTAIIRDLVEVDRRYQVLVETAGAVIVVLARDLTVLEWNREAERLSGRARELVVGTPFEDTMFPVREAPLVQHELSSILASEGVRSFETDVQVDGDDRVMLWNARRILDDDDVAERIIAIGTDITERRRAHARTRLAELGAIAAKIVHDIGNPLSSVGLQAQLIERRASRAPDELKATLRRHAGMIKKDVQRLAEMVQGVKSFAREQKLNLGAIDLPPLIDECIATWRPELDAHDIQVTVDDSELSQPTLVGDANQLRRVFDNLLKNSLEAIDVGPGEVVIRARTLPSERLEIVFEDTGPGFDDLDSLFSLFHTTKPHGTGLGLPIVRQIIEAHGGTITAACRSPHGAVFNLALPRQPVEPYVQ